MKMLFSSIVLTLIAITLCAQQLPIFSQFQHNYMFINPAMLPHEYVLEGYQMSLGGTYRHQWSQLQNGPRTATIRGEYVFELKELSQYNKRPISLGSALYYDQTGPIKLTGIHLKGTHELSLTNDTKLLAGLSLNINQFSFNGDVKLLQDPDDPVGLSQEVKVVPNFSVGVVLNSTILRHSEESSDNLLLGYAPNYVSPKLASPGTYQPVMHHYFLFGMINYFSERTRNKNREGIRSIENMLWIKYVKHVPVEGNFNFNITLNVGGTSGVHFGGGLSFDFAPQNNFFNSLYFEPGLIIGDGTSNFMTRLSFIFYMHFDELRPHFGETWEPNFGISLE